MIKKITPILLSVFLGTFLSAQTTNIFEESEGLVIIDLEEAPDSTEWKTKNDLSGFNGSGYLEYEGTDYFNSPGNSIINLKVKIEKTGTYRFQWRSRIAVGESNTEHNDSWLKFGDASKFYGKKIINADSTAFVYPKGSGLLPNPKGSSKDGWLKIYQNTQNAWTWQTSTNDENPFDIFVEFDTSGIYSLQISGRSAGHAIDRLSLYHESVASTVALDLSKDPSDIFDLVGLEKIKFVKVNFSPNPTSDFIYLENPHSLGNTPYNISITDISGIELITLEENSITNLKIPVQSLVSGTYLVTLQNKERIYRGSFFKE